MLKPRCCQYILSLAEDVNAVPLPAVPEVFGVRLPPASECLSSVDFDLIPNKPPPGVKLFDEEIEEIEESESESEEEEEDIEMTHIAMSRAQGRGTPSTMASQEPMREEAPFPISAIATPSDIDMIGTPAQGMRMETEEASDLGDDDEEGLFAGGDDEEEESDAMEEVSTALVENTNGVKRKLVEEDDYD
jgi:transcription initiation factor TFIID subunit 9B